MKGENPFFTVHDKIQNASTTHAKRQSKFSCGYTTCKSQWLETLAANLSSNSSTTHNMLFFKREKIRELHFYDKKKELYLNNQVQKPCEY